MPRRSQHICPSREAVEALSTSALPEQKHLKNTPRTILRGRDLFEELIGERFAGLVMDRQTHQRLLVVAPVLHELAGQLDRVPFHVANSSRERLVDGGQHVLQAVTEFVKERLDFAEGHQ